MTMAVGLISWSITAVLERFDILKPPVKECDDKRTTAKDPFLVLLCLKRDKNYEFLASSTLRSSYAAIKQFKL